MGRKTKSSSSSKKITLSLAQFQDQVQSETDLLISEGVLEQVPTNEDDVVMDDLSNSEQASNQPESIIDEEDDMDADLRLALALQEEEDLLFAQQYVNHDLTHNHPMRVNTAPNGGIQIGGSYGYDFHQRCNRTYQMKVVLEEHGEKKKNTSNTLFDDYEMADDISYMLNDDYLDYSDEEVVYNEEEMSKFFGESSSNHQQGSNIQPSENESKEGRLSKKQYNQVNRVHIPSHVRTSIQTSERKEAEKKIKTGNKMEDRATVESVLDMRTRMILYKMRNNGTIESFNGNVSTGKEANVYHGTATEPFEGNVIEDGETGQMKNDLAIKIYKTSVLVFKDRDRYVSGDWRFKTGYSKTNPRKMVKVWAEKEMRNLQRLDSVGIRVPKFIALKKHVLLIEFIGNRQGWPAPRLKDASIPQTKLKDVYVDIIKTMRNMYHKAKLVHADLSEYNMLYYKGNVYYIDVAQSVEHDHPHALEFLRNDCQNIITFFTRRGLGLNEILTTKELFDFVTDVNITDSITDSYLNTMFSKIQNRPSVLSESEKIDDEVFKRVFIPRTLIEIKNPEDHQAAVDTDDVFYYKGVTGINNTLTGSTNVPQGLTMEEHEQIISTLDDKEETVSITVEHHHIEQEVPSTEQIDLSSMDKKERKHLVKEQNREKRKNKTPKKIKKQLIKQTSRNGK